MNITDLVKFLQLLCGPLAVVGKKKWLHSKSVKKYGIIKGLYPMREPLYSYVTNMHANRSR